mgnify:CR=1 FL=1
MFTWEWENWRNRGELILLAWNRENPENQGEPEWAEELIRRWFALEQLYNTPPGGRSQEQVVYGDSMLEDTSEFASRLPHGLVQAITGSKVMKGK